MDKGVWQLRRLTVRYCDLGGSSRGVRDFVRTRLAPFAEKHPHIECVAGVARGRHPVVQGEYLKHKPRVISLRNLSSAEVEGFVNSLRDSNGHRVSKFAKQVFTARPSVQGMWDHRNIAKRVEIKIETL